MKKKHAKYIVVILVLLLIGAASVGPIMSQVDIAPYEIEKADGAFEIRHYPDLLVAETSGRGERMDAMRQGFRPLADFIFGNNDTSQPIAMTAPVIGQSTEMGDSWTIRFVMPQGFDIDNLPAPMSEKIHIAELPASRYVVLRFAGRTNDASILPQLEKLKAYVAEKELTITGEPVFAFYNPPWTLPFLRRNEIWWQLQDNATEADTPAAEQNSAEPATESDVGDSVSPALPQE